MMCWSAIQYTDVGSIRTTNEDSLLDRSEQQLWIVADGMGGHEAGDYASQHVVANFTDFNQHRYLGVSMANLRHRLDCCNQHLFEKARVEHKGTIGCTVAALAIKGPTLICSWSGDSRIYRFRDSKLLQLTRDHSHFSLTEDRNYLMHPSAPAPGTDLLTAAIGGEEQMYLEHSWFSVHADDRFLLCTDGLYKEVGDSVLESVLHTEADPQAAVDTLAGLYKQRGARDNVGMLYVHAH